MDVGNDDSPNCYGPEYQNVTESSIIDYIETVVLHDLQYPTYKWLSDAGIVPSNTTGVKLDEMLEVLTNRSGSIPFVRSLSHGGRCGVLMIAWMWWS
jgi:ribonuclease T2